jgi:hypothetical protein
VTRSSCTGRLWCIHAMQLPALDASRRAACQNLRTAAPGVRREHAVLLRKRFCWFAGCVAVRSGVRQKEYARLPAWGGPFPGSLLWR